MSDERRWHLGAILVGVVVDMGGSYVFGFITTSATGIVLLNQGVPADEISQRMYADKGLLIVLMIVGLLFSGMGGFVAARIAKRREVLHGAATGGVSLVLSLAMGSASTLVPWWYYISFALVPPVALMGGVVGRARNQRAAGDRLARRTFA